MSGNNIIPSDSVKYGEVIPIIERARENAFRAVNRELISMYWDIGKYVSDKLKTAVGANPSCLTFQNSSNRNISAFAGFRRKTSGVCASFTKPIAAMKNSHHW